MLRASRIGSRPARITRPGALDSGSERVVQLSVHVGDDPAVLAEAFVQRHAAELWPAIESTRLELQATVEDNIEPGDPDFL